MYRQAAVAFPTETGAQTPSRRSLINDWWVLYFPSLVVTLSVIWWECLPVYIGYALSAFAALAVVAVVRADTSSSREKLIYGAICAALLVSEAGVAYRTHARAESFLVCRFSGNRTVTMDLHGKRPIRSAFAQIVNQYRLDELKAARTENGEEWFRAYQHLPLGVFAPGQAKIFAVKDLEARQGITRYRVQFSAEDDYWWEDFQSVSAHGEPVSALRIVRYIRGKPSVVFEDADKDYPRDAGNHIDWAWASTEP